MFGFVKLLPRGDSNIKESSQYIDEIEPDSPVPFNVPIESNGLLSFGEHDVRIIVSYKDAVRDEHTVTYDTTITIVPFEDNTDYGSMIGGLIFPITTTTSVLDNPLRILSLSGPDGITLLFPNSCSPSTTTIEKSLLIEGF